MSVDLEILAKRGCAPEALRKLFSADPADRKDVPKETLERVKALHSRIRSRVQEGMTRNLQDWQWAYAIDVAWDTPYRQITPTLLQTMLDDKYDKRDDSWKSKIASLGLDRFIIEEKDKDGKSTGKKMVNVPAFFTILIPLVKSYVTLRRAAIVNRRRQTPLLKYEPVKTTTLNKMKCEALTDRVQVMATQYGYFEVLDQVVLKMLQYGTVLPFIIEEWHSEKQVRIATAEDAANKIKKISGVECNKDDEIEVVVREGLRYKLPHPTRTFRDLAHPLYTINSDSGCMFAGYWEIVRYRDLLNRGFWNVSRVAVGNTSIMATYSPFFQSVYSSCKLTMPCLDGAGAATASIGTTGMDIERQLASVFYGNDQYDQGVLVTNYVEKLVPSENGLGNYAHPVWFKFMLAGDGCTILYATPLPDPPMLYAGYDPDESRDKNSSMALETIPFQDHFGMTLSQIILSAKQNLANLTFINEDVVDEKSTNSIKNIGESLYRHINILGASFKRLSKLQNRTKDVVTDAVESFSFPKANISEMTQVLKTILDVCDRVMQISNLEMAQAASHEQSAEEVRTLSGSTDTRLIFTGTPVDNFMSAWKRQIYSYTMAYGDEEFYAHVPSEPKLTAKQLEALGFAYADVDYFVEGVDKFRRIKVNKNSIAHPLHEFASNRDDIDRTSDVKVAAAMAQIMTPLLQNPITLQALGADQIIQIAEKIAHLAGVDRDFHLHAKPVTTPDEQKQQAAQQLQQVIELVMKLVDKKMMQDLEPVLKEVKTIQTEVAALAHIAGVAPPAPTNPTPNAQPPTIAPAGQPAEINPPITQ